MLWSGDQPVESSNFTLPVGPGHQRGVPATWLSETGLHVPQRLRRGQSNPGVNRRGLSETLEVGLRKPPVRREVLVESPSPFSPSHPFSWWVFIYSFQALSRVNLICCQTFTPQQRCSQRGYKNLVSHLLRSRKNGTL